MGDCTRTPSPVRFCCIVVDRLLTCREGDPERLDSSMRLSVVVDRSLDKIIQIQEGVMDAAEDTEMLICPPGSTLMPGFIDCHVHLTIATDDYQLDHLRLSSADKSLRALKAAQGLLRAGFTTVRSAGDADAYFPSFAVARSITGKDFIGPRIVGAGHYISVTGGGGDINFLSPDNCPCSRADGVIADGREEMIKAVRHEIKHGSDWIKLLVTNTCTRIAAQIQKLIRRLLIGNWGFHGRRDSRGGQPREYPLLVGGDAGLCGGGGPEEGPCHGPRPRRRGNRPGGDSWFVYIIRFNYYCMEVNITPSCDIQ